MVPVGSSVMLELVLAVHSYHVIAYLGYSYAYNIYYYSDSVNMIHNIIYEGRSRNTRKNTATLLSLFQGLQVHSTTWNHYCQIFMHEIIDFNAVISPL